MPTKLRRITVSETRDLARRLDLAAQRFPELAGSRSRLLLALTEVAEEALASKPEDDRERREAAWNFLLESMEGTTVERELAALEERDAYWDRPLER